MEDNRDYVILRTYRNVWKIDRKIYSLEGLKLPFPLNLNELMYFIVSIIITYIIISFIPFIGKAHFIFKYFLIPYGIMKFLTKQKLDGKYPHKYFFDMGQYLLLPKRYNRFRPVISLKKVKFISKIGYRRPIIIDKTETVLKDSKKSKKAKEGASCTSTR